MSPERERQGLSGKIFYGWIIAVCCTLVTIINGGIFFTFSVFFNPVAADFAWSRGEFSGNYTAMLVAYAPGAFFAGRIAERRGPRAVLLVAAALIGLGYIGCSSAQTLTAMILSYATIGLGVGATLALPTATIQRWFVKWRATMVGIVNAGMGIGGFIFAPLSNLLIASYGWRAAYLTIGLIYGGVIALAASFMAAEPAVKKLAPLDYGEQERRAGKRLEDVPLLQLNLAKAFKLNRFRAMIVLYILNHIPALFITSHLVPYVIDCGISADAGAQGLGLMAGMSVLGRLAMSWVAGRIGWIRALSVCYMFATAAIIWLIFVDVTWEFYLFTVIYGFFWGSNIALLGGAVGYFFGMSALSELLGFLLGIGVLVSAVSPWLGGLSFDLTSSYLIAMVIGAIVFAAAGVVSLMLSQPAK